MPRFTLKMNVFSSICLETHKCVLEPSEQGSFSQVIDLRGHMPRFTLKMNIFLSMSLVTS